MVIKMVAMGVWGRLGYLGDSWNRLDQGCTNAILIFCHLLTWSILFFLWHLWKDCFIVIAGALEYCLHLDNMNLTAIRTIRVLRPLRAINRVPSMRILVMLLLGTAHNIFVFHFVWKINRCCKKVAEALKLKNNKVEKTVHKTSAYWS